MSLFRYGDFKLHSGAKSKWKLECDALTQEDIKTLAYLAAIRILKPFGVVTGVPTGGLLFAEALRKYSREGPDLIVDDVFTTGASMEEYRAKAYLPDGEPQGIVIFARGKCPEWVKPILQLPEPLWSQ